MAEKFDKHAADYIKKKESVRGKLPDTQDKKNILKAIENYEKANPGDIGKCIIQARMETNRVQGTLKQGGVSFRLAMPLGLLEYLKPAYPFLISDTRQFEWFLKNFPDFDLMAGAQNEMGRFKAK